ncbi:MAG: hypothetical protein CME62_07030 [Halobacteriovoraceae bacterium]|nr:hypothetical protein [Halobacteriovoraceae bacterium]|tara:strand:- start:5951 stop:6334 length:384 start_codon:yes stop_codon:yes gene_type:complete
MHISDITRRKLKVVPLSFGTECILGRSIDHSNLILKDPNVSRKHLQVKILGNCIYIQDLGTKNGTYLNSRKVIQTKIIEGDMIHIGSYILTIKRIERVYNYSQGTTQFLLPKLDQSRTYRNINMFYT